MHGKGELHSQKRHKLWEDVLLLLWDLYLHGELLHEELFAWKVVLWSVFYMLYDVSMYNLQYLLVPGMCM